MVDTFPKGIRLKVNVIAKLEIELAYKNVAVQGLPVYIYIYIYIYTIIIIIKSRC